ncbi:unnamed protein product, partial [marine sediment metagenome]
MKKYKNRKVIWKRMDTESLLTDDERGMFHT